MKPVRELGWHFGEGRLVLYSDGLTPPEEAAINERLAAFVRGLRAALDGPKGEPEIQGPIEERDGAPVTIPKAMLLMAVAKAEALKEAAKL